MNDLRIALVQMSSRPGDAPGNLARIDALTADAGSMGVGIVCFPELAVTGYGRTLAMTETGDEDILLADLAAASLASARGDENGFLVDQRRPELYAVPADDVR